MSNNPNESPSSRVERPDSTIKRLITPLSSDLKIKINTAITQVINKIKEKHLS
jgi:hypothetical protein